MGGKNCRYFEKALCCTLLDVSLTVELGELGFFPSGGVAVFIFFSFSGQIKVNLSTGSKNPGLLNQYYFCSPKNMSSLIFKK